MENISESVLLTFQFGEDFVAICYAGRVVVRWTSTEWMADPGLTPVIANTIRLAYVRPDILLKSLGITDEV